MATLRLTFATLSRRQWRGLGTEAARIKHDSRYLSTSTSTNEEVDVLIVGGGVVGSALARSLRDLPIHVGLVHAGPPPKPWKPEGLPHPRSYALSPSSLELLGLRPEESDEKLGCYQSMQVWEENQPGSILFTNDDLQNPAYTYLGAVVEDAAIVDHLWRNLGDTQVWTETKVERLVQVPSYSRNDHQLVEVQLDSGKVVQTQLLIAADGAQSAVRKWLGLPVGQLHHGQEALTCTVELTTPMPGTAFQRFLQTGPLALLPTRSPNHAIVVWSTNPLAVQHHKQHVDRLPEVLNTLLQTGPQQISPLHVPGLDQFLDTIHTSLALASTQIRGTPFTAPPSIAKVVSPVMSFELSSRVVLPERMPPRVAIVGDAAHTVHPHAGQGLNLGLGTVQAWVTAIEKAASAGQDLGLVQPPASQAPAVFGIHALQHLFAWQSAPAKHAKSLGLSLLQGFSPARAWLAQTAAGTR